MKLIIILAILVTTCLADEPEIIKYQEKYAMECRIYLIKSGENREVSITYDGEVYYNWKLVNNVKKMSEALKTCTDFYSYYSED